jgi:hypothetical protein
MSAMQVAPTSQNLISLVTNPFMSLEGCSYQVD